MYVFLAIFVIIIIIIIIVTFIISINFFPVIRAKRRYWRKKKGTKLPKLGSWGGGLRDSGNARKKTFFPVDVFPYSVIVFTHSRFQSVS